MVAVARFGRGRARRPAAGSSRPQRPAPPTGLAGVRSVRVRHGGKVANTTNIAPRLESIRRTELLDPVGDREGTLTRSREALVRVDRVHMRGRTMP